MITPYSRNDNLYSVLIFNNNMKNDKILLIAYKPVT